MSRQRAELEELGELLLVYDAAYRAGTPYVGDREYDELEQRYIELADGLSVPEEERVTSRVGSDLVPVTRPKKSALKRSRGEQVEVEAIQRSLLMQQRLGEELRDGLPDGEYGSGWWEPCPYRVPAAMDSLIQALSTFDHDDWLAFPYHWAEEAGYRVGDAPCHLHLLEESGLTAVQFCNFWWALLHHASPRKHLAEFAHRCVLDLVLREGHYWLLPKELIARELSPSQIYGLTFVRDGLAWRIQG